MCKDFIGTPDQGRYENAMNSSACWLVRLKRRFSDGSYAQRRSCFGGSPVVPLCQWRRLGPSFLEQGPAVAPSFRLTDADNQIPGSGFFIGQTRLHCITAQAADRRIIGYLLSCQYTRPFPVGQSPWTGRLTTLCLPYTALILVSLRRDTRAWQSAIGSWSISSPMNSKATRPLRASAGRDSVSLLVKPGSHTSAARLIFDPERHARGGTGHAPCRCR